MQKSNDQMSFISKLLVIVSGIVVGALAIFIFTSGNTWLNSDSAAPVNLALEQIRTGKLFPDSWYGSTSLLLLNYPLIFILKVVPSYLLAKDIAQILFAAIMLIAVILFSHKVYHNRCWVVLVPILFSFISGTQYEMLFIQCAYTSAVCCMLLTLSTYFQATNNDIKLKSPISFIVFLLMLFASSLLGIMSIQQITIPMLGAIVVLYFLEHSSKKIKELPNKKNLVIICLLISTISIAGYMISKILMEKMHILGNSGLLSFASSFEDVTLNISIMFQGFLHYAGIQVGVPMFSLAGIQNLMRLVVIVLLAIIFPIFAFRNFHQKSYSVKFLLLFTLFHTLEVLIILTFTKSSDYIGCARYELTSINLLTIVSGEYIFEKYIVNNDLRSCVCGLTIALFAILTTIPSIKLSSYQEQLNDMSGISNYLIQNDLSYGYASFWHAGKNTILSNGNVQINAINVEENKIGKYLWLSSDDWYNPDMYEGTTFLLLTNEELSVFAPNGYENLSLGFPQKELHYQDYTILVYNYNVSNNNFNS